MLSIKITKTRNILEMTCAVIEVTIECQLISIDSRYAIKNCRYREFKI